MKCVFIRVYPWLLVAGQLLAADPLSEALQKGLFEEEANHNLEAAIKAYQSVIDQTAEQRRLTATAVFRLGECYRKLNKTNEAVGQYQRVVREFSDVPTLANLSQQNLAALGVGSQQSSAGAAATSAEAGEIEKIKAMIKDSPDLINARGASQQTPLHKAALNGYVAVARFLLANKAQVDSRDNQGNTALHLGTLAGHKTLVELLLDHGADVNAKGNNQSQPLHSAAANAYQSIVEILVARKADLNGRAQSDTTPLHAAVVNGHAGIAKYLLDRGADVNAQDNRGWTPLHQAISSPELTQLILSYKPELEVHNQGASQDRSTPLIAAALYAGGQIRSMELLLQAGADVNKATDTTALMAAVRAKSPQKVQFLLQHKADPNQAVNGVTPLGWYINNAHSQGSQDRAKLEEIAELLRKHGAKDEGIAASTPNSLPVRPVPIPGRDPQADEIQRLQKLIKDSPDLINGRDQQNQTALHRAAAAGQTNVLKFLLTNRAEINIRDKERWGSMPLHKAVMSGRKSAVEMLLANGADVHATGSEGQDRADELTLAYCQPLHMAVMQGNQAIAETLVNAKADVNGRDYRGRTPLHFAVYQGFLGLVRLLVSKGADVNAAEEQGRTPAMLAVTANYQNIFDFLMEQGIDVNAQNKDGQTLLHQAAYQRPPRIMQPILARRPDLELGDKDKSTPLITAVRAGNIEAARLLLEAGANPNQRVAQGYFPLFMAAAAGNKALVELLIKHKADINQRNSQSGETTLANVVGRTAAAAPHEQKALREVADLLRKHGAKEEVSSVK